DRGRRRGPQLDRRVVGDDQPIPVLGVQYLQVAPAERSLGGIPRGGDAPVLAQAADDARERGGLFRFRQVRSRGVAGRDRFGSRAIWRAASSRGCSAPSVSAPVPASASGGGSAPSPTSHSTTAPGARRSPWSARNSTALTRAPRSAATRRSAPRCPTSASTRR